MTEHPSHWIAPQADADSCCAPLLRRDFNVASPVDTATLRICGLGYYEASLNGRRVGDHVLDPAQTDYESRVFYVTHDVTALLQPGDNAIGVMLGNGWYNQDRVWGKDGLSYGTPRLWLELQVGLADGSEFVIRSDRNWAWAPGPVTDNNIYAGECYDARLEQTGWNCPGFDQSDWSPVAVVPGPTGTLEPQSLPPIRRIEELTPVAVAGPEPGRCVVDMGQNFSGWARIRIAAEAGHQVTMRFAETVDADGEIDTGSTGVFATGVEQTDRYTCKGEGEEVWEPRFTYHGFRYVEVTGWPGDLTPAAITGVVVHTDFPIAGGFACSDDRLNRLHDMALWTHRSNCHGLPEDCPARERCGWLGDANMVAEYSLWNFDSRRFWEKFLGDIETTRAANGGIPCNVAPGKRCTGGNANPDWAAAMILLPWFVYLYSGDDAVLSRHWDGMSRLMEHFEASAEDGVLPGGYGDFFDPGTDAIVMHTPETLTSTFWFYRCARIMATSARALGKTDAADGYDTLQPQIAAAVAARFFDADAGSFGSQTADAMALAFGICPDEEQRILAALLADILQRDTHLNVGIFGVRFLFEVLTQRGHGELALRLMHQDSYPGFGHLIARGATTVWECWGEAGHDGTHGPRSLSHPFMGGYDNWFYNTLAGIQPDPAQPGFRHFFLRPHPVRGLDWVRAHHDCPHGRIASAWRFADGALDWSVQVPTDARASATLPFTGEVHRLGPGSHHFTVEQGDD